MRFFFVVILSFSFLILILPAFAQSAGPLSLLPAEGPTAQEKITLPERSRIFVRKFKFSGNTIFPNDELAVLAAPYENREISPEELQALRQKLTQYYVERGYINSGVTVPDQKVEDGTITLKITEGSLTGIEVEGARYFRPSYIRNRLARSSGPPLNVNDVRQALQLLQQDPRIRSINAELTPGVMPGEGVLKVKLEEERPYKVVLAFGNNQPPSVGSYRGEITLAHQNLFGLGDVLEGSLGLTEGNLDYALSYAVPVSAADTTIELYHRSGKSMVIEESFRDLEIISKSRTSGLAISHPVIHTPANELTLSLAGELRRDDVTFLDGEPLSGGDSGVTHVTVLRFSQEWVSRGTALVIAAQSMFSLGIHAFGATEEGPGPDGRFLTWSGQLQGIGRLSDGGAQLAVRAAAQLASGSLPPMEKFSVGGMNSVRGYRENLLVRDNGVAASLEFRLPVIRDRQGDPALQFVPFFDIGGSWNASGPTPDPITVSSIGAGFRWAVRQRFLAQLYAGHPLRKVRNLDHDLQDDGIHFQFSWQVL